MTFTQLKNLPVHRVDARGLGADLRDLQDLPDHAGQVHPDALAVHRRRSWSLYFGVAAAGPDKPVAVTLPIILLFSLIGIAGSYGVAWFGIRVNTFANSRTAFASLRGKPYPDLRDSAAAPA